MIIELLEELLDLPVGHVVVKNTAEFCVYDENHTPSEDVVVTEELVDHGFFSHSGLRALLGAPSALVCRLVSEDHFDVLESHQSPVVYRYLLLRPHCFVLGEYLLCLGCLERVRVPGEGFLLVFISHFLMEVDSLQIALVLHEMASRHDW